MMNVGELGMLESLPYGEQRNEKRIYRNYLIYRRIRTYRAARLRRMAGQMMAGMGRTLLRWSARVEPQRGYAHG
jgi:hypothetical protein